MGDLKVAQVVQVVDTWSGLQVAMQPTGKTIHHGSFFYEALDETACKSIDDRNTL
jgi:hypothetical protein